MSVIAGSQILIPDRPPPTRTVSGRVSDTVPTWVAAITVTGTEASALAAAIAPRPVNVTVVAPTGVTANCTRVAASANDAVCTTPTPTTLTCQPPVAVVGSRMNSTRVLRLMASAWANRRPDATDSTPLRICASAVQIA